MNEPTPFNKGWYLHKLNGPGLRYEIALYVFTVWLFWVNRPSPCVNYPEISIFRHSLKNMLDDDDDELILRDRRYRDSRCLQPKYVTDVEKSVDGETRPAAL